MRNNPIFELIFLFALAIFLINCKDENIILGEAIVTDIDGNVYHTVKMGKQTWMVEDLRTSRYNDGTPIPNVEENNVFYNISNPAYRPHNNFKNDTYGFLYNWFVVNTGKLAPKGWHVPTDVEWTILEKYLISRGYNYDGSKKYNLIGKALASNTGWLKSTDIGDIGYDLTKNNSSCFSALPGGDFGFLPFDNLGTTDYYIESDRGAFCHWWTSTEYYNFGMSVWIRELCWFGESLIRTDRPKSKGYSVRCIKD